MDSNKFIQIYTIGYSTETGILDINEFFECLSIHGIKSFIDIRGNPLPLDFPEYDRGHLHQFCENKHIGYHWAGKQLGDINAVSEHSRHQGLIKNSLQAYADYMETNEFQIAVAQIINMAMQGSVAVFSKQRQVENDFRLLLSDYLLLQGLQVTHILSSEETQEHMLHKYARRESSELIYDNID